MSVPHITIFRKYLYKFTMDTYRDLTLKETMNVFKEVSYFHQNNSIDALLFPLVQKYNKLLYSFCNLFNLP